MEAGAPRAAVRLAAPDDLEPLIALAREYCLADGHEFVEARARAGFTPLLAGHPLGQVWVAEHAAGACDVGYAVVTFGWSIEGGGAESLLDELYVRQRGEGIGSRLLEAVLNAARVAGASRMFLETELANEGARRLYTRHGFEVEDSIWMQRDL